MSFPRYAKQKDSGVDWLGSIPSHWNTKRLRFVAAINPSKSEVAHLPPDTEVSFLPMEAIGEDGSLELERVRPLADVQTGYTFFMEGDVTIAKITPCFENGKGAAMRGLRNGIGFGTTELIVTRPIPNRATSEYLHWLFTSQPFRKAGEAFMYGAGGQKRVPDDFVRDFEIGFPPLEEQRTIAAFLDRETAKIDALVEGQKRLIDLLKEKRQAVISQAVTKGLDPNVTMKDSGVEWLGLIPKNWDCGALTRVADRVVVGIAEAATHAYANEGIAILRSTNIRAGKISGEILYVTPEFADGRATKLINAGDLVTVRTGNAGVTAVVPQSLDGCQCFTMLITSLSKSSLPSFYCYMLNSLPSQRYFALEGWGTAQVNISVPILKALAVAIPPVDEQRAIVAHLDRATAQLDRLIAEAESATRLLQERRAALISAAVTGKIDVRGIAQHPSQPAA